MGRSRLLLLFVLVCSPLLAAPRSVPTLNVEGDDGNVALELSALQIRVTIRGHLARTEYELTYRNSLDRDTGGEFYFPLPPNAEVSDLGLYFDGKLRHGVAVERVLARSAYEETIHRRVDPALVEWSTGRGFRFEVYPIPEHGEKKVVLAYDQELTNDGYTLDLRYGRAMKFDATIDTDGRPLEVEGSLHFVRDSAGYAMHSRSDVIDGIIKVARDERESALLAYSRDDGMWYASAAIDVRTPGDAMPAAPRVVILYDTSSSSVQQNAPLLRRFLSAFLSRQTAWATADVIPFHIALDEPRHIDKAALPAGQRELERVLSEQQPLGATNLLAVISELPSIAAQLPPSTRIVLITDGLTSVGDSRIVSAALLKLSNLHRPLLVVNAASAANDQLLGNAARATGGWSIDLTRVDPETAAAAAMRVPANIRFGEGIVPSAIVTPGDERVAIAARANDSLIHLPRELPLREIAEASMVRRAWARAKLREMLATGASDEELIAHGRKFTQLTPRTSLLVLDSWWDYERYDIPLPPDVAEAKACYEQRNRPLPPLPPMPTQVTTGGWSISGRVLDIDSSPLPGVTVILMDGTSALMGGVTDDSGRYRLWSALPPANPHVIADLSGFGREDRTVSNDTASVEILMEFAGVAESITVTAEAPLVDVRTVGTGSTVGSIRRDAITTDQLLNTIARDATTIDSDDPEVLAAVAKQRRELTRQVVAKLQSIGSTAERVRYYISARALLGGDKSFHVFAAEAFRARSPEIAARVLSDLAEARPDDSPLLRILARVLDGWDEPDLAKLLLQRAIEISPGEPQSWREMILLAAKHGRTNEVATLAHRMRAGVFHDWRIEEINGQLEEVIARAEKQRGDVRAAEDDDLTIELMFDADWSYVDIHIIEPGGEDVSWNNTSSKAGGKFSGGYIFGFGPEIYSIRNAPRGEYRLDIHYYSDDQTNVSRETLAHIIVYSRNHRGTMERHEHFVVLQLAEEHRTVERIRLE